MHSHRRLLVTNNDFRRFRRALASLVIAVAPGLSGATEGVADEPAEQETQRDSEVTPLVVSAAPLAPSLLEFSRPASVMRGQQLEERVQSTLGETVDLQPGVRSSFFGAGASRPVIRGFSGERIRTLRNGVSTGDVSSVSDDHVVVSDPLEADQIEILRGPETLLFGSSAIGGVVNVIDGSIPEFSLGKPFEGSVLGQFGNSADNEKTGAVKLRGEEGSINWYGSAFSRRTDSYEIPGISESRALREREKDEHNGEEHDGAELNRSQDAGGEEEVTGIVPNTASETFGGTVGASHVFDEGFVGIALSGFDTTYGVPGHSHGEEHGQSDDEHLEEKLGEDHGDDSVRIDGQQVRADLRGRYDTKGVIESIRFRLGATDYEHTEFEGESVGTVFAKEGLEARAEFTHQPLGALSGVVGLHTIYDDFSALGEAAFLPQTESLTRALFLYEDAQISDSFTLQGGTRLEAVTHDPVGNRNFDAHPLSVSGGFRWDLDKEAEYSLSSSLAYAERAASPVELYAEGIHYVRRIREQGNSTLSKERSTGIDLAFRKNTGLVTASVTPFYQYFQDYINLRGVGGPEKEFPLFVYEETGATFWGAEFVGSLHLDQLVELCGQKLSFDVQSDIVRARDRDRDSYIPRTPPVRNIVRARWEHPSAVQLMVEGVLVDAQRRLAVEEIPTDGYSLINSEVSYRIGEAPRSVRLFLRGTNLTNEEARVHTSFLKDLAPLRGRSFVVGFRGTF